MPRIWIALIASLLALSFGGQAMATDALGAATRQRLDAHLRVTEQRYGAVGQTVIILRNGREVYAAARGDAALEPRRPARSETAYPVFSVSKLFANVLLMQLVEAGSVELDAPVGRYLSGLPERWSRVTVRQALSHRSGLPEYFAPGPGGPATYEAVLRANADKPFQFEPGTATRYNQTNYVVLKRLVEAVAGQDYRALAQAQIVKPLRLRDTGYGPLAGRAVAYEASPAGPRPLGDLDPPPHALAHTGLTTSAPDLARWFAALLDGRLVKPATLRAAWTAEPLPGGGVGRFAQGWEYAEFGDHVAVGHSGGDRVSLRHVFRKDGRGDAWTVIYMSNGGARNVRPFDASMGFANVVDRVPLWDLRETVLAAIEAGDWPRAEAAVRAFRRAPDTSATVVEATLNDLGYEVLFARGAPVAIPLFRLIAAEHPASANALDSLAEAYAAAGDRAQAIASYRRALEVDPAFANARTMLQQLEAAPPP